MLWKLVKSNIYSFAVTAYIARPPLLENPRALYQLRCGSLVER